MDLKIVNNIDSNVFSTHITFEAYGSEQLSEYEEKEIIQNFPIKLAYRNLRFTKNIKIDGTVPVITEDEPDGETVVSITLPPLSNKEIPIDETFDAYYKIDYSKIPSSVVDEKVLTNKSLIAQAYCKIFATVVCDEVKELMGIIRAKAPSFEGENIVSV